MPFPLARGACPCPTVATAVYANVAVHAAALAFAWSLLLSEGDYGRAFGYALLVNGLRLLLALPYTCKPTGAVETLHPDHAKLALVLTGVGGLLTGALLCMRGVLGDTSATVVATPMLLVILCLFDPTAALPVFLALDADRGAVRQSRTAGEAFARVLAHVRSARIVGIVAGQFLFAVAILGRIDTAPKVQIALGAILMAAQIPLLPLGSTGSSSAVREGAGASRVAGVRLRETDYGLGAMSLRHAVAVEMAVSLALSVAISTWTHDAVSRWDHVYNSPDKAWVINAACIIAMIGAVVFSRMEFVRLDTAVDAPLLTRAMRTSQHVATPRPPLVAEEDTRPGGGDGVSPDDTPASDDADGTGIPPAHVRLMGHPHGGRTIPVLSEAYLARLRRVAYLFGLVLLMAIGASALLDISMSDESVMHVFVATAVIMASVQVDQLAEQVALAANAHLVGTRVHVFLVHLLAGVRAAAYVVGFLLAWFWRDQLHATAYIFAFLPLAYATL